MYWKLQKNFFTTFDSLFENQRLVGAHLFNCPSTIEMGRIVRYVSEVHGNCSIAISGQLRDSGDVRSF